MSNKLFNLLKWLNTNGCTGHEPVNVSFKSSISIGIGCYAQRDYKINDVIFNIPRRCIIGFSSLYQSVLVQVFLSIVEKTQIQLKNELVITTEFLIFLMMIEQLSDTSTFFHPYMYSLEHNNAASILSWQSELLECLLKTNLISSVQASQSNIDSKLDYIKAVMSAYRSMPSSESITSHKEFETAVRIIETVNKSRLRWAWFHYLSRRYPDHFAFTNNNYDAEANLKVIQNIFTQTPIIIRTLQEKTFDSLGSLCPLLDILNHNPNHEWLRFEVTTDMLRVICNHPVKAGQELYSNYGPLDNEKLLYAYGFAIENNPHDRVALSLVNTTASTGAATLHYIGRGGFTGITKELWKALSEAFEQSNEEVLGHNQVHEVNNVNCSHDDATEVEVGYEELCILRECLQGRMASLIESEAHVQQCISELIGKTRIQQTDNGENKASICSGKNGGINGNEGDDRSSKRLRRDIIQSVCQCEQECYVQPTDSELRKSVDAISTRALYIRWYRLGQREVLEDALRDLESIINQQCEDEASCDNENIDDGEPPP